MNFTLKWFGLLFSSFLVQSVIVGQESFNLEQAIKYSQEHSTRLKIQKLDVQDAKDQIAEYYAIGYPKLGAKVGYNYFINVPTSILPDFISPAIYEILVKEKLLPTNNATYGGGVPVQFGTKNNLNASLELSTLIFDGSFFVGLKAQKLYKELITKQIAQSEADVRYQVTKAYLASLVVKENLQVLEKNRSNLQNVYKELNEIFKAGFVEKLDVERIELSLQQLESEKEKLDRIAGIAENLLKFQMNYPLDQPLIQSQTLDDILKSSYIEIMDPSIRLNPQARPEYTVIDQAIKLSQINIKRYKGSYLPSLFGFASHQESLQRNKLFDSKDNSWFPTTVVGLNLNVPIFDGFDRKAKISKAKTVLFRTELQRSEFERGVQLEFENAKTQYINALTSLDSRKKSLALAEKIYNTSKIKFKEGVGSSLEITTAERDLYQAQANILDAQYNLIVTKVELDKALGKI